MWLFSIEIVVVSVSCNFWNFPDEKEWIECKEKQKQNYKRMRPINALGKDPFCVINANFEFWCIHIWRVFICFFLLRALSLSLSLAVRWSYIAAIKTIFWNEKEKQPNHRNKWLSLR